MNGQSKSDNYFFYAIPICIIASVLLASVFFWFAKKEFQNHLKGVEVVIESNTDFDATLYYTYSKGFDESHTIRNAGNHKDTLFFLVPKGSEMVKQFRLDFGNDTKLKKVKIKSFSLLLNDRKIVFDEDETFNSRFLASSSVFFNRNDHTIEIKNSEKPFDPYIVFPQLGQLALTGFLYPLSILTPFLVLIFIYLIKYRKEYKITIVSFLVLFFIICIPLKIAWTTFSTLLLCAYGIGLAIYDRKLSHPNSVFYIFAIIFLILMLLGRPSTFSAIDKLLSLLLFAIISVTISFPKFRIYRFFLFVFLIFNAIVISSGIHFLIWFNDFYGLNISDYFFDIKTYSEIVRGWLYYEHAAFLSFFGLVGMLFAHSLFRCQKLDKKILCLYDVLLLIFIVLVGTRICLLIYLVFLLNMFVTWNFKKRLLVNTFLFSATAVTLIYNIEKIDQNRHYLWAVSWDAIKQRPWFGYGLGESNEILHNDILLAEAGFTEVLNFNHSHNQFITYFLEIGIVGLTTLAVFLTYYLYMTKLYRNNMLLLFCFGLGYMFLTESILETSKPLYVLCFVFFAITLARETEKDI